MKVRKVKTPAQNSKLQDQDVTSKLKGSKITQKIFQVQVYLSLYTNENQACSFSYCPHLMAVSSSARWLRYVSMHLLFLSMAACFSVVFAPIIPVSATSDLALSKNFTCADIDQKASKGLTLCQHTPVLLPHPPRLLDGLPDQVLVEGVEAPFVPGRLLHKAHGALPQHPLSVKCSLKVLKCPVSSLVHSFPSC